MQISRFVNGGFVLHKIPANNGRASAWFDRNGLLLDIEAFNARGASRKAGAQLTEHCKMLGRVHSIVVAA